MGFNGKDYVEVKLREIWLRDGDKNNKFFFFFFTKWPMCVIGKIS